jgi:aminoglycoside phosphotransferase family enzyme/predicted kinase
MAKVESNPQADVLTFLMAPGTYPVREPVTHITTHGAHVFLCGDVALKIKRAVRYDYMDLSTPELRHAMVERELDLNRPTAPDIYRDVVPITREADGTLHMDGHGPAVEWVLRMNRFPAECEMTAIAARGGLTDAVASSLGRAIHAFHQGCPTRAEAGDRLIGDILDELERVLVPLEGTLGSADLAEFLDVARARLAQLAAVLRERAISGHVRRVHGDLHLGNLLLIDGHPVLFDALEFDDRLATCDVLYDLGFLLMDLCHQSFAHQANAALNTYLLAAAGAEDRGMAALPLFMAVRAAIRAMVVLQTDVVAEKPGASSAEARLYLSLACGLLRARKPVLIAVGGASGTGKTTLASDLAARIATCPGAVHLRTDTERKQPVGTTVVSYAPDARAAIYRRLLDRAENLLAAGGSVILDGTFLDERQRQAAEELATSAGVPFRGVWLMAPPAILIGRVSRRHGDASDADATVVQAQIADVAWDGGPAGSMWMTIDASGTPDATRAAACARLDSTLQPANS